MTHCAKQSHAQSPLARTVNGILSRKNRYPLIAVVAATMFVGCTTPRQSFKRAQQEDTAAAYTEIIQKYGRDSHYGTAAAAELVRLNYEAAQRQGTIAAYSAHLRRHPSSPYSKRAQAAMVSLAWQLAQQSDTRSSYQAFLSEYPDSQYTSEAKKSLADARPSAIAQTINDWPRPASPATKTPSAAVL